MMTIVQKLKLANRDLFGKPIQVGAVLIIAWCCVAWFIADYYYQHNADTLYQSELQTAAEQLLDITHDVTENTKTLKGVAAAIAHDAQTLHVLRGFGSKVTANTLPEQQRAQTWRHNSEYAALNQKLFDMADSLGADLIYIVNAAGDCFVANNFQTGATIGSNYVDRIYFSLVKSGKLGHQYAMGRTTHIPGLFYAHPVIDSDHFLGATVVKRDIAKLSDWTNQANSMIADSNGVIVVARDKNMALRSLPGAAKLSSAQIKLQYQRNALKPLRITPWKSTRFPNAVRLDDAETPIVLVSKTLPEDGLTFYTSRSLGKLLVFEQEKYLLFALLLAAGIMLILGVGAILLYWRNLRRTAAELRLAATAFESQQGMMITDSNNNILQVNRAFSEINGYRSDEVIGKNPSMFSAGHPAQDAIFYTNMWQSIHTTGTWEGELWNRRKNGEMFPEHLTITAVCAPDGSVTHYVGTFIDITASKAAAAEIEQLAFYDSLTGLPNRRLLLDRLEHVLASRSPNHCYGALMFIDMDNFKTLNDTLGHDIGDLLLQQVAGRLQSCLSPADTVARLGGDEFVVLLENLSHTQLEAAAQADARGESMLLAMNQPYLLSSHEYHLTSSIGITVFADSGVAAQTLFKQADIAMYQAKKSGRNTLRFFDQKMQESITGRASLEIELRKAMQYQQFRLHYQVQMDHTNSVCGAEALIRWQHPQQGWMLPDTFIPLSEETGLITSIGLWVIDAACAQLQAWQDHPLTKKLLLSVNVSPRQLRQADFVNQVRAIIQHYDISAQHLKFEITESMLLENIEVTIATLNALGEMGIQFSLDDFGTGYSSLQYLKRLPLHQLKIDQSFIRDVVHDSNDQSIVRSVIAMAKSFDLQVLAEGVETECQRAFLMDNGCLHFQGYLFSEPLAIEQFDALLHSITAANSERHLCV